MTKPTHQPLTDAEIAEIEAREQMALKGPMEVIERSEDYLAGTSYFFRSIIERDFCSTLMERKDDAAFYAHARTDIPRLVADLKAAREVNRSIQCSFCGHLTERTDDAQQTAESLMKHVLCCEKHPMGGLVIEASKAQSEVEQLKEVIAKLPHTADGAPIVPGMTLWWMLGKTPVCAEVANRKTVYFRDDSQYLSGDQFYSTRESALAATGAGEAKSGT